ncbi:MAG TPA: hypothetical protein VF678_00400, partial [bacterium]
DEEVFWLLVAAVVHDLKHPGHGNMWEVKHDSAVARRYAYESVLENQSIDQALELLRVPACRFTDGMPLAARERGRELLRTLVLATDFSHHGEYVAALNTAVHRRIGEPDYPRAAFASALLPAMLKAADIGNTTKPFPQAVFWADRAMREIWAELHGDAPLAWTPQQRQTHLCRAQIDFVERNALGLFSLLGEVDRDVQGLVRTLHDNLLKYQAAAFCRPLRDPLLGDEQRPPLSPIATPA